MADIAHIESSGIALEQVVIGGDLAKLQPSERMEYYANVCKSVGLNPLTRPFEYIRLNGKLTLYARRDACDQLRRIYGVELKIVDRKITEGVAIAHVMAKDKTGRSDEDIGAVSAKGLAGDALANALMKCVTKAKRRVTLSICGLGWLDETEIETIPDAVAVGDDSPAAEEKTPPAEDEPEKITAGQVKRLKTMCTVLGVSDEAIKKHFALLSFNEILLDDHEKVERRILGIGSKNVMQCVDEAENVEQLEAACMDTISWYGEGTATRRAYADKMAELAGKATS